MTLHLKMPSKVNNLSPKISVIGVGGTGGNIINSMIHSDIKGVNFLSVNTDSQALKHSLAENTLQLGPNCTQGLGAGADPAIGKLSAEEVTSEIQEYLENSNMVFITAGMGGGTGTGASPIIAKVAKDLGILIVGVVTKPFDMEGPRRMNQANEGIKELQKYVDNLIVIPNQNIYHFAKPETTITEALQLADNVLIDGAKSIIDLMVKPGLMNHDFADVKAVMSETGKVHMGTGMSNDKERSIKATENAICNPLLENNSMTGAKGVLINITGGNDITLHEVDLAVNRIKEELDENAIQITGLTQDETFNGNFKISVIATGIDSDSYLSNQIHNIDLKEDQKDNLHYETNNEKTLENYNDNPEIFTEKVLQTSENKLNPDKTIKILEEQAKEYKKKEEVNVKSSLFSKLFGKTEKKSKINLTSNHLSTDEDESNLSKNNDSESNHENKLSDSDNKFNDVVSDKEISLNVDEKTLLKDEKEKEFDQKKLDFEDDLLQIPAFLRRQAN